MFGRIVEVGTIGAIKKLVKSGVGIAFVYECVADADLQIMTIDDFFPRHDFALVQSKQKIVSSNFESFVCDFFENA